MSNPTSIGYVALLRRNRNFRRLWYGQIVSQLGDWLDSIALFTLLLNLTGSGQAVGLLFIAEFLPAAITGTFAGVVVDRLPRKLVMIATDIGRALLVLLLLFVNGPEDIWLVYLAVSAKVSLAAFFEPSRSAILPSLCAREELVAANAISGVTWSAMLALGAALGGLVAGTLGVQAAFILDAASFLLSAALIATVQVGKPRPETAVASVDTSTAPMPPPSSVFRLPSALATAVGEFVEGLRYIFGRPDVAWLTFTKMLWSVGGGVLLLLTIFGRELFPLGRDGAISIGLLYAARGIGTAIGPFVALRLGGSGPGFLRRAIGPAFFITGAGYLLLSGTPTLILAMLAVLFAHTGGSIQWVFSTTLLQLRVPDRLLGRVFAAEYAGLTLTTALSGYVAGLLIDVGVEARMLSAALAGVFCVMGAIIWIALRVAVRDRELAPT